MKKLYDLAVRTGSYIKDGLEKGKYENIGAVMEGDNGKFMFLKRSFNPAGVPFKDGSESIIVSMFTPKKNVDEELANIPEPSAPVSDEEIPFQGGCYATQIQNDFFG